MFYLCDHYIIVPYSLWFMHRKSIYTHTMQQQKESDALVH